MIILDTNVVSELMRITSSVRVVDWVNALPGDDIWLTAVTYGELLFGIASMPEGKRKREVERVFYEAIEVVYVDRILPFDRLAASALPEILLGRRRLGLPISPQDAQIAAIAKSLGGQLPRGTSRISCMPGST